MAINFGLNKCGIQSGKLYWFFKTGRQCRIDYLPHCPDLCCYPG